MTLHHAYVPGHGVPLVKQCTIGWLQSSACWRRGAAFDMLVATLPRGRFEMIYQLRLLRMIWLAFRQRKDPKRMDGYEVEFIATPLDVELAGLATFAYTSLSALARWHMVLKISNIPKLLKNRWKPLTFSEHVRYNRGIKLFQPITIKSRIIGWDGRRIYCEHAFFQKGKEVATAYACGAFREGNRYISPPEMVPFLSTAQKPDFEAIVAAWQETDQTIDERKGW